MNDTNGAGFTTPEQARQRWLDHKFGLIGRPVWGRWSLDKKAFALVYTNQSGFEYDIDLDSFTESAEILDWIFQIAAKSWIEKRDIADLILAIQEIFNPQASYCSWGGDHKCDPRKVAGWILGDA